MPTRNTQGISSIAELLQGKWTVDILYVMRKGPVRLSALRRQIPLASKKALVARLRALETARIILRKDLSDTVLHVEYAFTEEVREPLLSLIDSLDKWETFNRSRTTNNGEHSPRAPRDR